MTERENNVYKAKLAEQAERYDGKFNKKREEKIFFFVVSGAPTLGRGHAVALTSRGLRYVEKFAENCLYISFISGRQEKLGIFNFVDVYV